MTISKYDVWGTTAMSHGRKVRTEENEFVVCYKRVHCCAFVIPISMSKGRVAEIEVADDIRRIRLID